jgi:dethiobiotin synthetase
MSSNTGAGKTSVLILLIEELTKLGFRVSAYKPIETGVKDVPKDAKLILEKLKEVNEFFKDKTEEYITSYTFPLASSPYIANNGEPISIKKITLKAKQIKKESSSDILLIESAGGIYTPINQWNNMADLAHALSTKAIFVATAKLGTISETLLGLKAMDYEHFTDYVWCINHYEEKSDFDIISKPFFDDYYKEYYIIQKDLKKFAKDVMKLTVKNPIFKSLNKKNNFK